MLWGGEELLCCGDRLKVTHGEASCQPPLMQADVGPLLVPFPIPFWSPSLSPPLLLALSPLFLRVVLSLQSCLMRADSAGACSQGLSRRNLRRSQPRHRVVAQKQPLKPGDGAGLPRRSAVSRARRF